MGKVIIGLDERKTSRLKGDKYPIILTIHNNYKTIRIRLKMSTAKSNWDARKMRLKRGEDIKQMNARIESYYRRAKTFLTDNIYEIELMSLQEFKEHLKVEIFSTANTTDLKKATRVVKKLNGSSLTEFAQRKIDRLRIAKKNGNADVIEQSLRRLYTFSGKEHLNFADVDISFLKDFHAYCQSRGNKPNTVSIYLRPIKTLFREAIAEGEIPTILNPFEGGKFKIPKSRTKNRALRKDDIIALRNLELEIGSAIWKARAYFLFMFNCRGMNFIDLVKLKKSQLKDVQVDEQGNIIQAKLTYSRTKLGEQKSMSMRLSVEALQILNHFIANAGEFVFPMGYTESKTGRETYKQQRKRINRKLKELAKLAGIDPDISTYYARHTWATLASRSNLPINMIREGLGHSDISTTQIYIDSFGDDELDDANDRIVA